VLAGVAGGFADRHGIDAIVVRSAVVVLSLAGGLGVVLYAVGALLSAGDPVSSSVGHAQPQDQRRNVSVGCITLGITLVVRSSGLWMGDAFMWPLIVAIAGVAVVGVVRPDLAAPLAATDGRPGQSVGPQQLAELTSGRHARTRLIAGAVLIALGLVWVGTGNDVSSGVRVGAWATAITLVGVALVLGPWLARLAQQAAAERRERIRITEREAMAAHLHDSVLQTLALIQRTADDPRRTITLARQQERELREWLYGTVGATSETLDAAVRAMAHEVETAYDVRVELVVVGDALMDADLVSFVGALREACVNAAKHSGVAEMSVFVESSADEIDAYVRDRGNGFDRSDTTPDRRGIAQSIEARVERMGGAAVVDSVVGQGTEVRLSLPRRQAASAGHGATGQGAAP
jgi:phage shock protein PspC (stress-responsive transcriptional regulator)/anti-sigma regulatory factor (Ser/Thr protein kinase)